MKLIIISIIVLGIGILGMCFNIIFRKNGRFPETEIEKNKEMRKRGIICASEMERRLWNKKGHQQCADDGCSSCAGCSTSETDSGK